jgi:peptidoglycan L-alanyl-D-glutamate endopeptidase CwlK
MTYKFSDKSKYRLGTCHQDIQKIFNEVIKYFDCTILEGYRDDLRQNELYRQGKSQLKAGQSKHNHQPSLAVDAVPYPINWNDTQRMTLFIGYVLGIANYLYDKGEIDYKLVSGIDWDSDTQVKDTTFFDYPHFELTK